MDKIYHSASWYRVANLKPRLRRHARIHRHHFRGQLWYVLQDRTSGRFHRFSPQTYFVVSLMDGNRTVQEIWDIACERLDDDVLTQDEFIRLLGQLHSADVLYGDVPPDIEELSDRGRRRRRRKLMMSVMNPLAIRLPLLDPDAFLTATLPVVRPLFSWFGLLLLTAMVGSAGLLAGLHWSTLTENIADRVFTAESVLLLLLAYPLVKLFHELGHGYAIKRWGGEVHEIGVMFLVFLPVPYVDASDSLVFQNKWHRAVVGAAGILVEVLLAAIAMFVWLNAEQGLVRAFAFNVMLIGGISTVLFNGNPLLRFDGYYVLCDLLEIPNLATRANRYLGYLIQRYAFGVQEAESPASAPGEPFWFVLYALASFAYRVFVSIVIAMFVSTRFFVFGVLIAIWAAVLMFAVPLVKQLRFLFTSPMLRQHRGRAFAVSLAVPAAVAAVVAALPLPYSTLAEGVVWVPGEGVVHASADGVVAEILAAPDSVVEPGAALVRLQEPLLTGRVYLAEARVREFEFRHAATDLVDRAKASIVGEELRKAEADLALAREREHAQVVRSNTTGRFVLSRSHDLVGRFVRKGDVLGYVVRPEDLVIRLIVTEDDVDLVRQRAQSISARLASDPARTISSAILREGPALTSALPSLALSTRGGGTIALDPTAGGRSKAITNMLQLDLKPSETDHIRAIGERVYVRFFHGTEPLAGRLYRTARQVFLRHFHI